MFKGAFTALITPFSETGAVDEKTFCNLVEWQIQEGIHGLIPVGTTGESPTLNHTEHKTLIEVCTSQAKGRVPIIAGTGSNSTEEAIALARHAEKAGVDGLLVVIPYYNKPNQRGLYAHFAAIARAVSLPIIIYNIPGRSVIDMTPETMGKLSNEFKNIVGVKDATGRVERVLEQYVTCGKDFVQLSGEDITALAFNAHGGHGCISVTSNVAPKLCAQFQDACLNGNFLQALFFHKRLVPLHKSLFIEPSPSGIKYAASKLGLCKPFLRLPLVKIEQETEQQIDMALSFAGLLS